MNVTHVVLLFHYLFLWNTIYTAIVNRSKFLTKFRDVSTPDMRWILFFFLFLMKLGEIYFFRLWSKVAKRCESISKYEAGGSGACRVAGWIFQLPPLTMCESKQKRHRITSLLVIYGKLMGKTEHPAIWGGRKEQQVFLRRTTICKWSTPGRVLGSL